MAAVLKHRKTRTIVVVAAALAVFGTTDVLSQSPPPSIDIIVADGHLTHEPVTSLRIGTYQIDIGYTTMDNVGEHFGLIIPQRAHNPDGDFSWFCLTLSDRGNLSRVWIMSSADSNELQATVDSVYATELPKAVKPTARCPAISGERVPLAFDNGLWLGASSSDIKAILGVPSPPTQNGWWRYMNEQPDVPRAHGYMENLDLKLTKGLVTAIHATYTEPY